MRVGLDMEAGMYVSAQWYGIGDGGFGDGGIWQFYYPGAEATKVTMTAHAKEYCTTVSGSGGLTARLTVRAEALSWGRP